MTSDPFAFSLSLSMYLSLSFSLSPIPLTHTRTLSLTRILVHPVLLSLSLIPTHSYTQAQTFTHPSFSITRAFSLSRHTTATTALHILLNKKTFLARNFIWLDFFLHQKNQEPQKSARWPQMKWFESQLLSWNQSFMIGRWYLWRGKSWGCSIDIAYTI